MVYLDNTQIGFPCGHNTTGQNFTIEQFTINLDIMPMAKMSSACFIDLEKADDRIPRESFGRCCGSMVFVTVCYWLSRHCIPGQKWGFMSVALHYNGHRGTWVFKWLWQECVLPPLLCIVKSMCIG